MHQAGRRVRQHHHADAVVRQQHAMRHEPVDPAVVHGDRVFPVPADQPAKPVGVRGEAGHLPGARHQHVRRELALRRGRRHHGRAVELPAGQLGQQPPGHVGGAGVDRAGGRDRRQRPLRHMHDDAVPARVRGGVVVVRQHLVHGQVRAAHPKRLKQPAAREVLPRDAGEGLHHVPRDEVPEVAVLELLAQVLAQRQEPQGADDLGAGPARLPDPGQVVPGQPGPVRQQVNDRQAVGSDGIVQPDAGT